MVERQGRLDQTGHAGSGHCVTDLGRDSAQDARPALRWREHASQRAKLGSIGRRHPQPMPLDEPDGRRIDPRGVMGPPDRGAWPLLLGEVRPRLRPSLASPTPFTTA